MLVLIGFAFAAVAMLGTFGIFDRTTIIHATAKPDRIVTCLATGSRDFIAITPSDTGETRVAVLNGRRLAIATYTISAEGDGSRVIFRRQLLAMTTLHWKNCV